MANCPEVGIAYNALWRVGAVVTPAIFLLPPAELRHIVDDAEARVVIATPEFADTAREAAPDARVISTEEFGELESGGESPIVERADDDLAALMYTGGTTGRAKGVMLSHENLWLERQGRRGHGPRAGDRPEPHVASALARVRAARDVRRPARDASRAATC